MSKFLQALFGVRVTVLYSNGAKMRFRARTFIIQTQGAAVTKAEWRRPMLSWSREPYFLNVDKVDAIWQGRA